MPDPVSPVVTVVGSAELEVAPDLATVSCTVHATADAVETVRSRLAAASQRITAVLAGLAPAIERSATTGLHIAPVFDRRRAAKVDHVAGTLTSQVVVHDLDRLSELVQALTGIENAQLDGPWWSLRSDNPAHRDVRLAAVVDGRTRADDYAAAFGAEVAALLEISDSGGGGGGVHRMAAFAPARGADEPTFDLEPAPQTVSAQVTLRFTIGPVDLRT